MAYVNTLFDRNFMEYASYVIKDRAIPHLDDGLKPVQRRIMHSLLEMDDGKFHKVANVVGHCMKYHPHGDASIYSALVVLANKELFIDRQGNFGNILTGDEPSAARYIECRINPIAKEILWRPELTEFVDSYDGRNREPVVFPAKIPLVIILGAEGIAVGMSTRILPHNFTEVLLALQAQLRGESWELYPDFPGGGFVDVSGYADGQGKVLVRARLDTSDEKRIVIREIPFGTTTESLMASIENAARRGKVKIAGISDFTTEDVEIEVKLPRGVYTQDVVDALYAFTDCEQSISTNLLVIRDEKPASMTVHEVVAYHARRLVDLLKQELEHERANLIDRLHMRTLERIFVEERIYKAIEEQRTQEGVVQAVLDGFVPFKKELIRPVTEDDVERLLKIPIRRISLYDIERARKEMEEIRLRLDQIKEHLADLVAYAIGFLEGILERHGSRWQRRTAILNFEKVDVREAAARNLTLRIDRESGYLGHGLEEGTELAKVSTYDRVLVIDARAVYRVIDVPEKVYIGKGPLHAQLVDKESLANDVFNLVYRDAEGYTCMKRFKIEQFILEKEYPLIPDGARALVLTTNPGAIIRLKYKKKPRLQKLEEDFVVADYLVKSPRAGGVRLSTKELTSIRLMGRKGNGSAKRE